MLSEKTQLFITEKINFLFNYFLDGNNQGVSFSWDTFSENAYSLLIIEYLQNSKKTNLDPEFAASFEKLVTDHYLSCKQAYEAQGHILPVKTYSDSEFLNDLYIRAPLYLEQVYGSLRRKNPTVLRDECRVKLDEFIHQEISKFVHTKQLKEAESIVAEKELTARASTPIFNIFMKYLAAKKI